MNIELNASLEEIKNGTCSYTNYYALLLFILNVYGREYILKLIPDEEFLLSETNRLYEEAKEFYAKEKRI